MLSALTRASSRFESAIGYEVGIKEGDVVVLSGDGTTRLLLPAVPVIGDPVVKIEGVPVEVSVNRRAGILRRKHGLIWPDDFDNIEVTFSHGYELIPRDVQDAVLEMAEQTYWVMPAVASVSAGGESMSFFGAGSTGVTQRWVDTVEKYVLRGDA